MQRLDVAQGCLAGRTAGNPSLQFFFASFKQLHSFLAFVLGVETRLVIGNCCSSFGHSIALKAVKGSSG